MHIHIAIKSVFSDNIWNISPFHSWLLWQILKMSFSRYYFGFRYTDTDIYIGSNILYSPLLWKFRHINVSILGWLEDWYHPWHKGQTVTSIERIKGRMSTTLNWRQSHRFSSKKNSCQTYSHWFLFIILIVSKSEWKVVLYTNRKTKSKKASHEFPLLDET